jgi:hypothetical protein
MFTHLTSFLTLHSSYPGGTDAPVALRRCDIQLCTELPINAVGTTSHGVAAIEAGRKRQGAEWRARQCDEAHRRALE